MDEVKARAALMEQMGTAPEKFIDDGQEHRFPAAGKNCRNQSASYVIKHDVNFSCVLAYDHANQTRGSYYEIKDQICWPNKKPVYRRKRSKVYRMRPYRRKDAGELPGAEDPNSRVQPGLDPRPTPPKDVHEVWKLKAKQAQDFVGKLKPAESHPYLEAKGVKPHGAKISGKSLVIPMFSPEDGWKLMSYQVIYYDKIDKCFKKRFLAGARKAGCCFPIAGKEDSPLLICEGFATGASLSEVTRYEVLVAFDCGNLLEVARIARKGYPERKIIICADNDHERINGKGELENIGLIKGREAALAINAHLTWPDFKGFDARGASDFNDWHQMKKGIWKKGGENA